MISWEGSFNWQGHALSGRPDFLNYLNAGDVTWDELWEFYRSEPAPQGAVRSLTRLFHGFLSHQYDAAGCWLDPEGEIIARLRAWAMFALERADKVPLTELQADLAGLVGSALVTPLYYQAAYIVFMEASVDHCASIWPEARAATPLLEGSELPEPGARRLPVYHPGPGRHPHLLGDAHWNTTLNALLASQYRRWNDAYAAHLPDPEDEEVWTTVGGEG